MNVKPEKVERKFGRKEAFVLFLIFWTVPYMTLGLLNEFREVSTLPLWLDDFVPFWAPAIIGYALYFPLCFFTFLVVKDEDILRKGVKAFIFTSLMTSLFFLIYPIAMVKPVLEVTGVFDWLVQLVWKVDATANAFPSQHVAYSFLCAFVYGKYFRGKGWIFVGLAVVVSISTMLVKQHYIWDVVSGFLIALLAYCLAFKKVRV